MKYILWCVYIFLFSIDYCNGQDYEYTNIYNPTHPKSLFDLYYNKIFFVGDSIVDEWAHLNFQSNGLEILKEKKIPVLFVRIIDNTDLKLDVLKKNKKVASVSFSRSDSLPLPRVRLCKIIEEGSGCKRLNWDSLFYMPCFPDNYNSNIKFHILSFITSLQINGKITLTEFSCGNAFPAKIKNEAKKLKMFDKMILKSIVLSDDFNNIYTIPRKEFTIQ